MRIIAIDPGQNGGITYFVGALPSNVVCVNAYSDALLIDYAKHSDIAFVESVHAMPHQGVTSMFNFGKPLGYILGVLDANGVDTRLITPQSWKKEFDLIGKDKSESIKRAKELYPNIEFRRTSRCKKEHDGMAESLLIMEYGRRRLYG